MKNSKSFFIFAIIFAGLVSLSSCQSNNSTNSDAPITKAIESKNGIGEKYGSRDPRTCADYKSPQTGYPSTEQAKEYFICGSEYLFGDNLMLVSDVNIELGKPRPYNPSEDFGYSNLDATLMVIPVQGSYKKYQILPISDFSGNRGKNCNISETKDGKGLCFKNSFGDWVCTMGGNGVQIATNTAPPTN